MDSRLHGWDSLYFVLTLSFFGMGVNGGYNLLDVELAPSLNTSQTFDLTLDDLTGQLILENGEQIDVVSLQFRPLPLNFQLLI